MDISVDGQVIFSISDDEAKILKHSIASEVFDSDIKRRLQWIIKDQHLGQRFRELKAEWEPLLIQRGATSLPVDPIAFAQLAFAEPDYKDASAKLADAKAAKEAASQIKSA